LTNTFSPQFERRIIRIAAAVIVDDEGRVLLVRKRGTAAYMLPGGKLSEGESAVDAMVREVEEELGCGVAVGARPLGRFSAAAANEPGAIVEAELFAVQAVGEISPAAEIDAARWHHPSDDSDFPLAPLAREHVLPLVRSWSAA
jgi:8-oxo-dGTP pyrophosphatase MutT (NUDIX family)